MKSRYLAMFPGQGSQYVGMAKEVLTNFSSHCSSFRRVGGRLSGEPQEVDS